MKKKWILLCIVVLNTFGFAQDTITSSQFKIFYYPNGQKSSEGILENGKPNGYWKSYNEKGVLISEGNRKNFQLDSTWIFYGADGKKMLEINYTNGYKNGPRIQYFEDEYIIETYRSDTLTNVIETFYLNSQLKKTVPIVEGKTWMGKGV